MNDNDIKNLLFETNAFRVCEEGKPFWYTSGKIGPYFINTHFLYGSEEDANRLLNFIDDELVGSDLKDIPPHIFEKVLNQYNTNSIYKTVVDACVADIRRCLNIDEIDYISGGERRDWYFSLIISYLLKKPHLTIFKNLTVVESNCTFEGNDIITFLDGKKVLHIADLLNQSSSYVRAWIPAITNLGSTIKWSYVVVDRMQGGDKVLVENNITSAALFQINNSLFVTAYDLGKINDEQLNMLTDFTADPDGSMRQFLIDNPDFIDESLASDEKTAKRAQLCLDNNLYNLDY